MRWHQLLDAERTALAIGEGVRLGDLRDEAGFVAIGRVGGIAAKIAGAELAEQLAAFCERWNITLVTWGGSADIDAIIDGWAARHFNDLKLRESEEIQKDRAYLEQLRDELVAAGLTAEIRLLMGDPASTIVKAVADERADLLAMATHGHRFLEDIVKGSTVDKVRHLVKVPVLLLQQKPTG